MANDLDITVIIPTRDRAESLRETLACLADADRSGLKVEVAVADNGSSDHTEAVVREFSAGLAVRYVCEPHPGKDRAVNKVLDAGGLGDLVAILDDDMSPEPGWFQGVKAISGRHPDCALFTGRCYTIPRTEDLPGWAQVPPVRCWAFSIFDAGPQDREFAPGEWPSGNHYWFRASALEGGRRLKALWMADTEFCLGLLDDGAKGAAGHDALTGHRIQERLLDTRQLYRRAWIMGRHMPYARLAYPRIVPQAAFIQDHPVLWRFVFLGRFVFWAAKFVAAQRHRSIDRRFPAASTAAIGMGNCLTTLLHGGLILRKRKLHNAEKPAANW